MLGPRRHLAHGSRRVTGLHALPAALLVAMTTLACNLPDPSDFLPAEEPDTYVPPPPPIDTPPVIGFRIVEVAPDVGVTKGFDLVEIRGGGFREDSRVFFGGSESPNVTVSGPGLIYAMSPPHPPGLVAVRVVNIDGTQATLEPGFAYADDVEIDSVSPATAPADGGIPVTVRGRGFRYASAFLFGGREAVGVEILSDTEALCTVPARSSTSSAGPTGGRVDVHVITPFGVGELPKGFVYTARPTVSGFAPMGADLAGGGTLTLVGLGLVPEETSDDAEAPLLAIGGKSATTLASSPDGTRLVVRIPAAGAVGPADLDLVTRGGRIRMPGAFHYWDDAASDAPRLLGVFPTEGDAAGGAELSIVAPTLEDTAGVTVTVGGEAATVLSHDASTVRVLTPPGTAGDDAAVRVEVDGEILAGAATYRYVATPGISAISPREGPSAGGSRIAVTVRGITAASLYELRIGGLPATELAFDGDTLTATAPPGSPGLADVVAETTDGEARLVNGYTFVAGAAAVHTVDPPRGAIAGNTWVRVYGVDLPRDLSVRFGGMEATSITWRSPTEVVVRPPRAVEPGLVDVEFRSAGYNHTLYAAFSYFDPKAAYGGTWGEPIDGSLNVTVLQNGSGAPVEEAMVVIGNAIPPRAMGYTDDRGQITLSDEFLEGRLDVTATKPGYSVASILAFDAENATLAINGPSQPGNGNPPPPLLPGTVHGTLEGVGKYLSLPPWPCDEIAGRRAGFCEWCDSDADCGGDAPYCTRVSGARSFCSADCVVDSDCIVASSASGEPQDFLCRTTSPGTPGRCIPNPGEPRAECFVSNNSVLAFPPTASGEAIIDLSTGDRTFSLEGTRLGEVAVYCLAGGYRASSARFRPVLLGVTRHVNVLPGSDADTPNPNPPTDVVVVLDKPLEQTVNVTFGVPPLSPSGPTTAVLRAHLDLGSDGVIPIASKDLVPGEATTRIGPLPSTLSPELLGAEYAFHASASTPDGNGGLPSADVLRMNVKTLDLGAALVDEGAGFEPAKLGHPGTVLSSALTADGAILAGTEEGAVIAWDGTRWSAQPITQGPALRGATPDLAGGVVFVGDEGRVLRFDGAWETAAIASKAALRGVAALGPASLVAVGEYVIWERQVESETAPLGSGWTEVAFGPPKSLRAVARVGQQTWAVGDYGAVLKRDSGGAWSTVTVPVHESLRAVAGTADGVVAAVGDAGMALLIGPLGAASVEWTGTEVALYAIDLRARDDIWAAGDRGTLVHFDGSGWETISTDDVEVGLRTLARTPDGYAVALGMPAVFAGPFLGFPRFTEPAQYGPWTDYRLAWREDRRSPAFYNLRIFGAAGSIWSIMAPGSIRETRLPDVNTLAGAEIVSAGPKSMLVTAVDRPGFDIDAHDLSVFSVDAWRAWIYMTHEFDSSAASFGVIE